MIQKTKRKIGKFANLEDFVRFAKDNLPLRKGAWEELIGLIEAKYFLKEGKSLDLKGETLDEIMKELKEKKEIYSYLFEEKLPLIKIILNAARGSYELEFDEDTGKFIIHEIIYHEFDPDYFPNTFFPNWFEKEHFEGALGRELTDEEFQELKKYLEKTGLADEISEIFYEFLNYADKELFKNKQSPKLEDFK